MKRLTERLRRRLPGWGIEWALLDDDTMGETDWARRRILLDVRLTDREARSTLAVEMERCVRGPGCSLDILERAAARQLIPMRHLIRAASFTSETDMLAGFLNVDQQILEARVEGLTATERARLVDSLSGCYCSGEDCWLLVG